MTMQLKTRIFTNGKSNWKIKRFSDELFIAVNGFRKQHTFRCDAEVISFESFLMSKGFYLRKAGAPITRVAAS